MRTDLTNLVIRTEDDDDHAVIGRVITAAFSGLTYADGTEADIVERLRRANALSVSLVAELVGTVIGHIAFSPADASDGTPGWSALGPVAVLPTHQRIGVGSRLIRAGLDAITGRGANGCIVLGDPAYYPRFGFELAPANAPAGYPAEFFMAKVLGPPAPRGPIAFHPAFEDSA